MLNSCLADTVHNAKQQLTDMINTRAKDNAGVCAADDPPNFDVVAYSNVYSN
jgi:hypothetical protein